jgi:hypothetical protein
MTKRIRPHHVIAVVAVTLALSACTPQQIAFYQAITEPYADVISPEQLHRLKQCESSGDYAAIGGGGRYRGAYQFTQSRWDGVAHRHFPWLEGADPTEVEPWWQDAMARALWSEAGAAPWPTCGRRI